jgi:hypothetical protein
MSCSIVHMDINIGFSNHVVYGWSTKKWFPLFIKSLFAVLNKQENTNNVHFGTTGNLSGFRSIDSFATGCKGNRRRPLFTWKLILTTNKSRRLQGTETLATRKANQYHLLLCCTLLYKLRTVISVSMVTKTFHLFRRAGVLLPVYGCMLADPFVPEQMGYETRISEQNCFMYFLYYSLSRR